MPTAFVTAPPESADELARHLVETRLAASVNRIACESTYRWDGDVVDEREVILLVETTDERYDDVVERIVERHPYEVPCVERFDETDVYGSFADWRADAVSLSEE